MNNKIWIKSKIFKGTGVGKIIGYPTLNLNPGIMPLVYKKGVYDCRVIISGKNYKGALYFGPRTISNKIQIVLEIHILKYNKNIYGENISFSINRFIRPPINFSSTSDLQNQIKTDIQKIQEIV